MEVCGAQTVLVRGKTVRVLDVYLYLWVVCMDFDA